MDSAPQRLAKPARRSLAAVDPAHGKSAPAVRAEVVSLPARAPAGAADPGPTAPSQAPARARLAYGLLKAAMDEAAETFESNGALIAGGWWGLQGRTVESVYASALAAIELMEALNRARGTKDVAAAHFTHSRRQREAVERQITEFLTAARNMISVLTAPPSDPLVDCSKPDACPAGPCGAQSIVERLRTLTGQQRRVLELIAEGLPNKVIAYELGLCETTVKAHVSGILRKLCVYNRARAIALLANIDLASIGSPPRP
jgi:DNA-binding NarL/FixJ family response regulator